MATIEPKTVYPYNGKEYRSIDELIGHLQDEIGANIIEKLNVRLPSKQALNLLELIVKNKKMLVDLLTVEIELGDRFPPYYKNVFDI